MFFLDKEEELSVSTLSKFIQHYMTVELPRLIKLKNYYDGKQDILKKYYEDSSKPCNKIVVNYCSGIVDNFNGYLAGVPVSYTSNEDISDILEVLRYNDYKEEDSEFLKNALIYGKAYEISYLDEDGKIRFCVIDTKQGFPIYTDDLNKDLLYFVRIFPVDSLDSLKGYNVEVYTDMAVEHFTMNDAYSNLVKVGTTIHYFNQVPVTVFSLNRDEFSSFEKIIPMQDAYNKLISASEDDFESFCDAYMVIRGMEVDDEELSKMKENRILLLSDDGEVSYLTKDIKDTALNNMLDELNGKIHRVSNSPDFGDENFANASGTSLKYKLIGFENTASNIATRFIKALQKRIELISAILYIKNSTVWRDINIIVSRNLPVDIAEIVDTVNGLKEIVSTKTLLSQIPFVLDVDMEMEEKDKEKENDNANTNNEFVDTDENLFNEEVQ